MSTEDRRAPGTSRMPFDGLVEVGGALGPAFEAQAVNVSEDGMLLRTAYLPEPGQPLTCRFDAGGGSSVLASGEVVWAQGEEKGGEFAIRFTDMDPESVEALKRMCGVGEAPRVEVVPGSKVRLHIEGLASPMRAKIKDAKSTAITVGSDLGFLQVGKQLELEDATSGQKRPAEIDRVEVAVDPTSHVPQLVVTLRYADVEADVAAARGESLEASRPPPASQAKDAEVHVEVDEEGMAMKGAFARNVAKVGPALEKLTKRAKVTLALLAARGIKKSEPADAPRRTTAPAPGGGLTTSGRRVVRGEAGVSQHDIPMKKPLGMTRQKAMIAGGVMAFAIVGAVILKKSHHETPATTAATDAPAATATQVAAETTPPPPAPVPSPIPAAPPVEPAANFGDPGGDMGAIADNDDDNGKPGKGEHHKHSRVTPFGNGPVHHGNVLHLKMDGAIESIEGAQQPTGFAVKIPGRKSLEAAGPLASRDSRIAAIKVSNDGAGAELTVSFKDGVPNYQVRADKDMLVIALAPAGALDKTVAKNDSRGAHAPKHGKHHHDKAQKP